LLGDGGRQLPVARKQRQRRKQVPLAQRALTAAAYDLKRLHDELDLANAAAAELDVVGHLLERDLLLDEALHLAQRVEDAVVQVTAVDERREYLVEDVALVVGARDEPRLDVGIALPVAPVAHEIGLESRHADGQRPALAER